MQRGAQPVRSCCRFFFQAEDGIRDLTVTGVQTCALPISETIPAPLLDRMELIRLDGYTEEEKVAIARDHLLQRQIRQAGLKPEEVTVDDAAIMKVIADHTREAGVRNLERELGKITRKVATKVATGALTPPVAITPDRVREFLGKPKFDNEVAARTAVPGVATGLAGTGIGGDVLVVEAGAADALHGHGGGGRDPDGPRRDRVKEAAQIALSYLRSRAHQPNNRADTVTKSL